MKFTKEFLRDIYGKAVIEDSITGTSRWSIHHYRIFEHEGKFYETRYSTGATEMQDESPYENEPDEIECAEVRKVEKTVLAWELVPDYKGDEGL